MYIKNSTQPLKIKFSNLQKTLKEYIRYLFIRTKDDTIFRVAASLSYTSLIAIVPLLAIGLAIFSAFPVFRGAKEQMQEIILRNFVPDIEQELSQYFADFVNATAQLTTIGVIGIAITAILMLSTIENSLNFIFKVHKARNIKTKITLYWTVITLGPLLLGTAFSLRGYVYTLQKFMPEYIISSEFYLSSVIPSIFTLLALILLYVLVPNKKVPFWHGCLGALAALIMFLILRKFFGSVMSAGALYKTLYGTMAAIPVLLIWIYCTWIVVIFGAIITASLSEFKDFKTFQEAAKTGENLYPRKKKYYHIKKPLPKEQK